jgi:peptidyl-prolyl cis-trans isomerase B (cyclophilin B)
LPRAGKHVTLPFMRTIAVLSALALLVCGCGSGGGGAAPAKKATQVQDGANPLVTLHTSAGAIQIELYEDSAPNTVANFVKLADSGYYEGITFHRMIKGFMMQGGCPNTKGYNPLSYGKGGPGYVFSDEPSTLKNQKGFVSMANSGPNTNGSQFFILFGDAPHLDGKHSVFGKVVAASQPLVDTIERDYAPDSGQSPKNTLTIQRADVDRKRNHAYEPKVAAQ